MSVLGCMKVCDFASHYVCSAVFCQNVVRLLSYLAHCWGRYGGGVCVSVDGVCVCACFGLYDGV